MEYMLVTGAVHGLRSLKVERGVYFPEFIYAAVTVVRLLAQRGDV